MTIRRILVTTASVLLAFVLAGCGDSGK